MARSSLLPLDKHRAWGTEAGWPQTEPPHCLPGHSRTKPHPPQGTSPPSEPPEGPANLTLHLPLPTESGLSPKTTDNPKGTAFSLCVKLGVLLFIPTLIQSSREAVCVILTGHEKGHSGITWRVCCVSTVRYQALRPGPAYAQCPGNG